jgi:autotransporter-associated beta strand protein
VAPQQGDILVFPAGATNLNAIDDFPAGTSFSSITIGAPGYALSGNALELTGAINANYSSGSSTNSIPMTLDGATASVTTGAELILSGIIAGGAGLNVSGGGTLALAAANSFTGLTSISGSGTTLLVDGAIGAVQVNAGAVLGGHGTVASVTSTGGTISPGDSPGVLNTGSVTLDTNSTFLAELDGNTPGNGTTGYDQVIASGAVNLAGAKLNAAIGGVYTPAVGDQLTIIHNTSGQAISGGFAGLPEGAGFNISGSLFRITYQGGSSHQDVVLTPVAATTTTTLIVSPQTSRYNELVVFTATVTGSLAVPTGTVRFYDGNPSTGGTVVASGPVDSQGMATGSTSTIGVAGSPHQIFAVYVPDALSTYGGSTSAPASLTITPITLTVTGVTAQNKIYDGTTTASIDTSSAVLVGVVNGDQVSINSTEATASFNTPGAGIGKPVTVTGLTLQGSGATNYVLAQPSGLTATIAPAPLTLSADNKTMLQGTAVPTLTFTASGLVGADTTTTAFTTQPVLTTTATSASPPGVYPITISGGVAPNYTITGYVPGTLAVVNSLDTVTTLASSSNPAVGGQAVTFTAFVKPVSPSAGTPTGTVTFFANGIAIGAATLNPATGTASITTSTLGFGATTVFAVYSGDSVFHGSQSTPGTQFVTTAGTEPIVTARAVKDRRGRLVAVDLVVQVLVTPPGSGVPTGSVTIYLNGSKNGIRVALNNGKVVLRRAPGSVLNHFVFARYNGFGSLQPSVSLSKVISRKNLLK